MILVRGHLLDYHKSSSSGYFFSEKLFTTGIPAGKWKGFMFCPLFYFACLHRYNYFSYFGRK